MKTLGRLRTVSSTQAAGGSTGKKAAKLRSASSAASNGGKRKMPIKAGGPCVACHTTGESKLYEMSSLMFCCRAFKYTTSSLGAQKAPCFCLVLTSSVRCARTLHLSGHECVALLPETLKPCCQRHFCSLQQHCILSTKGAAAS